GAEKTFEGPVIAKAFDFSDSQIKNHGGLLRLRKVGDKVELTFKKAVRSEGFKKRIETETYVADFDATMQILLNLGLKEVKNYSKKRESYRLGDIKFDMDFYSEPIKLLPMIEIESTEQGVRKGVEMLGYKMKDTSTASIWALLKLYKEEN
ncbi:CYTH domain-containing protein, partial [Candidatus Woesearchaeota archaeon]|nr:CYTH domain-containing protein [Candidatus Woesearchaeota archaeon]